MGPGSAVGAAEIWSGHPGVFGCPGALGRYLAGTGRQFSADLNGEVQVRLTTRHLLQAFGDERGGLGNVTATLADIQPLRDSGLDDGQIFAITAFVALRLAFSTINDSLGAQPDTQGSPADPGLAVRVAVQRPVRAGDPAFRRRRRDLGAGG